MGIFVGLGVSGKVPGLGFEDSAGFFFPRNVGGFTPPSGLEISWEKPSSRNFPGHHPRKFLYLPFPRLGDGKGNYRFGTGSHFVGRSNGLQGRFNAARGPGDARPYFLALC